MAYYPALHVDASPIKAWARDHKSDLITFGVTTSIVATAIIAALGAVFLAYMGFSDNFPQLANLVSKMSTSEILYKLVAPAIGLALVPGAAGLGALAAKKVAICAYAHSCFNWGFDVISEDPLAAELS